MSARWSQEAPPGSGILHDGRIDGNESTFGLSFEYRAARHIGVRAGLLFTTLPIRSESVCGQQPVCEFTQGPVRVIVDGGIRWSVDDDGDLRSLFLEIPFVLPIGERVEIFAGPTIANLELDDVRRGGLDGLEVDASISSPAYGFHLGSAIHFGKGWGARTGSPFRPWSVAVIARRIRAELALRVRAPALPSTPLLTREMDEDLTSVTIAIGRRFGG
jgi:hypothetical protein